MEAEMKATMKRIVAIGPKKNVIEEVPIPTFGNNQLLVRNTYVGVCMSEHYGWQPLRREMHSVTSHLVWFKPLARM